MTELHRQRIHHLASQLQPEKGRPWLCWAVLATSAANLVITLTRL